MHIRSIKENSSEWEQHDPSESDPFRGAGSHRQLSSCQLDPYLCVLGHCQDCPHGQSLGVDGAGGRDGRINLALATSFRDDDRGCLAGTRIWNGCREQAGPGCVAGEFVGGHIYVDGRDLGSVAGDSSCMDEEEKTL